MKTFKQFIMEEPLPLDFASDASKVHRRDEYADFDPITGKFKGEHPKKIYYGASVSKFQRKFKSVGEGSSRIAFLAPIDISLFKAKDLKGLKVSDGQADTVIKVAMNDKGIVQNGSEVKLYSKARSKGYARYLAKIIDWAGNKNYGNDFHYVINHSLKASSKKQTAPIWIQMEPIHFESDYNAHRDALEEVYMEEFGFYSNRFNINQVEDKFLNRDKDEKKYQNCLDWIQLRNDFKLGDLHDKNVGIRDGHPVIVDFGFDETTSQVYWGKYTDTLYVEVNDKGEIEINLKGK